VLKISKKYDSKIRGAFEAFAGSGAKILSLVILLVAVFLLPVHSVCAIGNIHFGSMEIHPFLSISEGYVDNVYLTPEEATNRDKKSSGYRSYTPGLRCDWNKEKYRFRFNYLSEIVRYDNPDVDDKDLYDLDSEFDLKFGKSGHGFHLAKSLESVNDMLMIPIVCDQNTCLRVEFPAGRPV